LSTRPEYVRRVSVQKVDTGGCGFVLIDLLVNDMNSVRAGFMVRYRTLCLLRRDSPARVLAPLNEDLQN
jgi:hypothetical protein